MLGPAWVFPICQTQHKDSCLLPNASVYLPNLAPSCLLPRQSMITTSARKAQEAAGHTAQTVSRYSRARPGPRPHTGKYVEMDIQALGHGTVHTHADEHSEIHSATYTLICALLQVTLCARYSTQAAYPHTHRWLPMMLTHCRKICRDLPASPVTSQMVGFSHWATI